MKQKQPHHAKEYLLKQLEEQPSQLELVLHQMPVGVIIIQAGSGELLYQNDASQRIFRNQHMPGEMVTDCSRWKMLLQVSPDTCPFARVLLKGDVLSGEEFLIRRADGTWGFVSANASPIRDATTGQITAGVVVFTDITERQQTREALQEREASLRLAILATGLGTFEFFPASGRLCWSDIAKRHYGLSPEAHGDYQQFLAGLHTDDRDRVDRTVQNALKPESGGEFSTEYRTVGIEDGKERWLAVRGQAFFDERGQATRLIGVCLDITDSLKTEQTLKDEVTLRLRAMEDLRRQEQLLIQQGRLAAMGEMIGNIAHQWRQPLNTLGLILQELPLSYEQNLLTGDYLNNSISKAMQLIFHMSQTIDGFRDFFKPDKEKKIFRIREVLEKTISIIEASLSALKLSIEIIEEDEATAIGCPNEYSQVILNILMNARDAFLYAKTDGPRLVAKIFISSGRSVLTIRDNAGGIPTDIIDKVFDPYFTTKGADKGTGLGLFMSKLIMTNMNGTLSVHNTGDGAEFRIEA